MWIRISWWCIHNIITQKTKISVMTIQTYRYLCFALFPTLSLYIDNFSLLLFLSLYIQLYIFVCTYILRIKSWWFSYGKNSILVSKSYFLKYISFQFESNLLALTPWLVSSFSGDVAPKSPRWLISQYTHTHVQNVVFNKINHRHKNCSKFFCACLQYNMNKQNCDAANVGWRLWSISLPICLQYEPIALTHMLW